LESELGLKVRLAVDSRFAPRLDLAAVQVAELLMVRISFGLELELELELETAPLRLAYECFSYHLCHAFLALLALGGLVLAMWIHLRSAEAIVGLDVFGCLGAQMRWCLGFECGRQDECRGYRPKFEVAAVCAAADVLDGDERREVSPGVGGFRPLGSQTYQVGDGRLNVEHERCSKWVLVAEEYVAHDG